VAEAFCSSAGSLTSSVPARELQSTGSTVPASWPGSNVPCRPLANQPASPFGFGPRHATNHPLSNAQSKLACAMLALLLFALNIRFLPRPLVRQATAERSGEYSHNSQYRFQFCQASWTYLLGCMYLRPQRAFHGRRFYTIGWQLAASRLRYDNQETPPSVTPTYPLLYYAVEC
jgi:hypothetical protein